MKRSLAATLVVGLAGTGVTVATSWAGGDVRTRAFGDLDCPSDARVSSIPTYVDQVNEESLGRTVEQVVASDMLAPEHRALDRQETSVSSSRVTVSFVSGDGAVVAQLEMREDDLLGWRVASTVSCGEPG